MQRMYFISLFALLGAYCYLPAQPQPPATKKETKIFNEHGNQRRDDYFWLSNRNDTNVINHLKAENAYTEAYLKPTEELQKKLYDEIVGRIEQKYESLPSKENGYWYYVRYENGKQYPNNYRRKGMMNAKEELLLDVNELSKGHKIYLLRDWSVSRTNDVLAYAVDTAGDRRSILYFKKLRTGQLSPEQISNTSANIVWANDPNTMYYVLNDPTVRPYKVMRHHVGSDPTADEEVYTEKDSTYGVFLSASRDNRYIFINSGSTTTSEVRYLNANEPKAKAVLIQQRVKDLLYSPTDAVGNLFYIRTNLDAKNFKLVTSPIATPSKENWKDFIEHKPGALLQRVEILKNYIVIQRKENGLNAITIINKKDNSSHSIDFGNAAYVANFGLPTDEYNSDSIRYSYTTTTSPGAQYGYNLVTRQKKLLKQDKVGGNYDASLYATIRLWAVATDGTKIPVSLSYKKSMLRKDGSNPLYLYAYGSYGASSEPFFNSSIISMLDRGFVYAIAHIRGGQELGREWYENGKLLKKKNTFTDYVDVAQYLVNEKYTSPDRIVANGGSAGGMLMGAITNMRPDLFRVVIAEVPWMDVITDMFDASLPLTTLEYDEWGDPNKKEYYDYMITWSPLDNVKKEKYPSIFATGGLNDTQVPYFSPAKWVAKVRENNLDNNPVLFKVNMGAGHGGESGRFERQKLIAMKYAFALNQLGWNEQTRTYTAAKAF
jgi:oligopeptidase B